MYKPAGPDNIFNEFLSHMGPCSVSWLSVFFSNILVESRLPREFKLVKVVAVFKAGKTEDLAESYRPITLLSCTFKLLQRLLFIRISLYMEAVFPAEQARFRSGLSCTNQVLALLSHIETGFQKQMKSTVVFIDLTAAYDTVFCNLISTMLGE
ncbi:jg9730 [Pararge aegeria aegeria]|uniref:Jg9730 protein n=1 Tax=Pararge aegeria aegeria TaxID=348720 RepID=A0A8S4QH94_9NEOP|nr:jg9730 [Pararge aegeria aegeria]